MQEARTVSENAGYDELLIAFNSHPNADHVSLRILVMLNLCCPPPKLPFQPEGMDLPVLLFVSRSMFN